MSGKEIGVGNKSVLGSIVKNGRNKRGLTQAQMAKYLDVSQQTYSSYESGAIRMSAEVFLRIAQILGMSVEHLVDYTAYGDDLTYKEKRELIDNMLVSDAEVAARAFEMNLAMLQSDALNKKDVPVIEWAALGMDVAEHVNETGQQLIKDYIKLIKDNPLMCKN